MTSLAPSRVLVARIAGESYALSVRTVREVLPLPELARIPGLAAAVLGLANVRGALVTVADARVLLGVSADTPPAALVVVQALGRTLGLAVDEVLDLVAAGDALPVLDAEALLRPLFPD